MRKGLKGPQIPHSENFGWALANFLEGIFAFLPKKKRRMEGNGTRIQRDHADWQRPKMMGNNSRISIWKAHPSPFRRCDSHISAARGSGISGKEQDCQGAMAGKGPGPARGQGHQGARAIKGSGPSRGWGRQGAGAIKGPGLSTIKGPGLSRGRDC